VSDTVVSQQLRVLSGIGLVGHHRSGRVARWLTPTTRQETSQTVEGTGYRHLEAQWPDCWVTINPLRRQLLSFPPRLSSKLLPQLLTNRFVGVTCSLT
jgi:hypothetical protein